MTAWHFNQYRTVLFGVIPGQGLHSNSTLEGTSDSKARREREREREMPHKTPKPHFSRPSNDPLVHAATQEPETGLQGNTPLLGISSYFHATQDRNPKHRSQEWTRLTRRSLKMFPLKSCGQSRSPRSPPFTSFFSHTDTLKDATNSETESKSSTQEKKMKWVTILSCSNAERRFAAFSCLSCMFYDLLRLLCL